MHASVMGSHRMLQTLEKNWWLLALRGLAAILLGILAVAWPGITLAVLVLIYGAFAIVDGAFALIAAIKGGSPAPRWWLATAGIAGVVLGVATLMWPSITVFALLVLIACGAIIGGVLQVIGAIKLRKEISNEWLLIIGGIVAIIFGVALLLAPGAGALALAFSIGAFAIVYGVLLIAFSFKLKRHDYAR